MKRLILLATFLFVVSSSYGANKMSMVTYFPVPYVAYSQVSADQQLDVGLTSACNMNLGCSESDVNLKAHTVNLQKGKLELNNGKGVFGQSISLGNGNGSGQVRFNNVRMQGGEMQSLNAESMNVRSLELFGKPFPTCKGKEGSDNGQMKWAELSLQGAAENTKELYLVCGGTETATGCPSDKQPTKGQTYQEDCSGSTQKITYTWDSSSCEYKASGTCPTKKKCLTNLSYCAEVLFYENGSNPATKVEADPILSPNNPMKWNMLLAGALTADLNFMQLPNSAELGKESASCVVGTEYFKTNSYLYGGPLSESGERRVRFPFARCEELDDCATPVTNCRP